MASSNLTAANSKSPKSQLVYLIPVLYFFSGFAALGFEVLWARALTNIFGVNNLGVVITFAAFMAGLGLGSLFGTRLLQGVNRPFLIYVFVELFLCIFAFSLTAILAFLDTTVSVHFNDVSAATWGLIQSLFIFLVLFLPAFIMGLAYPAVVKVCANAGISVGVVYGINTLGGAMGALFPLFSLPIMGWQASNQMLAVLAGVISLCALLFISEGDTPKSESRQFKFTNLNKYLIAYAIVGAAALMLEVAWTRIYGMLFLRTEYTMGAILFSVLLGVGLGSMLAHFLKSKKSIDFVCVACIFLIAANFWLIPWLSQWAQDIQPPSLLAAIFSQVVIILFVTLPITLLFGAMYPLMAQRLGTPMQSGPLLYTSNSIGAAIGVLLSGFVFIPAFGVASLALISILLLIVYLYILNQRWLLPAVGLASAALVFPVAKLPPAEVLLPNTLAGASTNFSFENALGTTHVVTDDQNNRLLLGDLQRMDASSEYTAVQIQKNQARLPLLLYPKASEILMLGLGTGVSASGITELELNNVQITAVELSQGAIVAARDYFSVVNGGVVNKIHIVNDDATRFLKASVIHYDIIIGDLFHPDLIGRSNLLGIEQFSQARKRLSRDGVFVQWVAINQFNLESFLVVLNTFRESFDYAYLFFDGFRVAMVGRQVAIDFGAIARTLQSLDSRTVARLTGGEGIPTWFSRFAGSIPRGLSDRIQSNWRPIIEYDLPRLRYERSDSIKAVVAFLLRGRKNARLMEGHFSALPAKLMQDTEAAIKASSLNLAVSLAELSGDQEDAQRMARLAYQLNPRDRWVASGLADRMFSSLEAGLASGLSREAALKKILKIWPDHLAAIKALLAIYTKQPDRSVQRQELETRLKLLEPFVKI